MRANLEPKKKTHKTQKKRRKTYSGNPTGSTRNANAFDERKPDPLQLQLLDTAVGIGRIAQQF